MPRKKKAQQKKPKREEISEMDGWSIGDIAWAPYNYGQPIQGEINKFYPLNKEGPAVCMIDVKSGHYRTVLLSTLVEEKPKKKRVLTLKRKKPTSKKSG